MGDEQSVVIGEQASAAGGRFANVVRLGVVDSTNRYLADAARAGAPDGLVVVADAQEAGRGRRDRSWVSPPDGALLCSVCLRPELAPDELHLVPSACGLALLDALAHCAGLAASLKWPNDVVVGERKLAGILAELVGTPERPALVVGVGLNLAWPEGWSATVGLPELAERATTLEAAAGRRVGRDELLVAYLAALEVRYRALSGREGRAGVLADYRRACSTLGRPVRVELTDGVVEGIAREVADDGRLCVERDGATVALSVGDVVHLRPGEPAPGRC